MTLLTRRDDIIISAVEFIGMVAEVIGIKNGKINKTKITEWTLFLWGVFIYEIVFNAM